jgi:hypothetical protein
MQSLCQAIGWADKTGKKTGEAHWEGCPDTVHRALPNQTKTTLRFSVDYRYQRLSPLTVVPRNPNIVEWH